MTVLLLITALLALLPALNTLFNAIQLQTPPMPSAATAGAILIPALA